MIDKNFIYAFLAAMALIVGYNFYYETRYGDYIVKAQQAAQEKEKGKKAAESAKAQTPPATAASNQSAPVASPEPAKVSPESPVPVPAAPMEEKAVDTSTSTDEKHLVVDTGVAKITLTNRGAVPARYVLSKYKDIKGNGVDLRFDMVAHEQKLLADGKSVPSGKVYPLLGMKFPKESFSDKINGSIFASSELEEEVTVTDGKPYTVSYLLNDPSGIQVKKTFTFHQNSYNIDMAVSVKTEPKWGVFDYSLVVFGLGDESYDLKAAAYSYHGPIMMLNKERIAEAPKSDKRVLEYTGEIPWAAMANRYYTVVGIPLTATGKSVAYEYIDEANYTMEWRFKSTLDGKPEPMTFFIGPKEHSILKKYTNGMYSIINYGWFDVIAKPIFTILNLFHRLTGNWGWSIILLTIVAKLLFFPLSQRSFRSMQKLQKLQPQLQKLQEIYKDDREKLNTEMLRIYREQKVNPLGGCLPMLLQIPIFFALYKVLLESIELKGAGWILWIKDLAQMDPYYVTPVLMGVSMIAQQWMTPKTGDPLQRKMMMALPFVFTFMFLTFPAGLVIYWLVSNILTIAQQWIIYREAK